MKKYTVILISLFSTFATLFCGPNYFENVFNAAGNMAKSPFALAGALLGVSSYEQQQEIRRREEARREQQEAHKREETRRREERRKEETLERLDDDFHTLQQSILQENNLITLLQQKLPELKTHIITTQQEKEHWQNDSEKRTQTISTLNKKLTNITEEYRKKELSLTPSHDDRIIKLLQETDAKIEALQQTQTKKAQSWRQSLAQATTEEQDLQNSKEELESSKKELQFQIEEEESNLTELVTQKIRNKQASTKHVLKAIETLGRSKDIFHATEHAHNVSLMVALILSGHFKTDDLSSDESNYESVPKIFFKETRLQLLRAHNDSLKEEDFNAWTTKLTRLGQKRFLCCSC